ncbi:hypothetical protein [Paenibacillus sp. GP183]|uniref:hypothetical protein n=1 Tax=Paenibacillus sp. GP183 TaxID=1882751 RepID=UPI0011150F07|nr:hypothetical protein [Paenibacillus sp. GP183]
MFQPPVQVTTCGASAAPVGVTVNLIPGKFNVVKRRIFRYDDLVRVKGTIIPRGINERSG